MLFDLSDKSIAVVGGAAGIGFATAEMAARPGARVVISSRNADRLRKAAAQLGKDSDFIEVDMTDETSLARWAAALPEIDYLVISASSASHGPFASHSIGELRSMFDAKFFGPFQVAQSALGKIRSGGSIMFFSGVLSRRPGENCAGLGAVNGAVESLTRGVALELGPEIRVNCMSPGMVRSSAYDNVPYSEREAMYQTTGASLPVGRVGTVDEIAMAVIAALANGYLTGQVLDVDGGHMIRQYASR